MKLLTVVGLVAIACGPQAPQIPVEPPPENEPEFVMPCALEPDMTPEVVRRKCGKPKSRVYVPSFPDGVIWKYCHPPCGQQYGVAFLNGKLWKHGNVYELEYLEDP